MTRYRRQTVLPELGEAGQAKLEAARVLVVGVGGLGCPALQYLAGAGVGALTLVDHDAVELSNLHRQPLFAEADAGRPKVEAAAERLAALNSEIAVQTVNRRVTAGNAAELIAGHDVVIDGGDQLAVTYALSDACQDAGIPLVAAAVTGLDGYLAICGAGAPSFRALFPTPPTDAPDCATAGVLGPAAGLLGTWQAVETLKLLVGIDAPLSGRLLILDTATPRVEIVDFRAASEPADRRLPARELDWAELPAEAELVDVRSPNETVFGVLPGARCIPLNELGERLAELPADRPIVAYCAAGPRSHAATQALAEAGFTDLAVLAGGYRRWGRRSAS